jgi:hypothetical protein
MKSQSALEFMTIVAIGLTLIAVASFFGTDYITSYFSDLAIVNAKHTVESIISAANLVYAQGVGATTKVYVNIPDKLQRNRTYIYGREINFRLGGANPTDFYDKPNINVYGSVPLFGGRTSLTVKMVNYGVDSGALIFVNGVSPQIVYVRNCNDSNCNNYSDNFSLGSTIYYKVRLADIDKYVGGDVNIQVYSPNGSLFYQEDRHVGTSGYVGNFTPNVPGAWIVSVLAKYSSIIGTSLVNVSNK